MGREEEKEEEEEDARDFLAFWDREAKSWEKSEFASVEEEEEEEGGKEEE